MDAPPDKELACAHEGQLLLEAVESADRFYMCENCLRVHSLFSATSEAEMPLFRRLAAKSRGSIWRSQGRLYLLRPFRSQLESAQSQRGTRLPPSQ